MCLDENQGRDESRVVIGLTRCWPTHALSAAIAAWGVGNAQATVESKHYAALRIPVWALPWLWRKTTGESAELNVETDEELTDTAVALWDPTGSGPLASLYNAFEAAKTLTQPADLAP